MISKLFAELPTEVKTRYTLEKDPFDIPRLPEAQVIVIPLVREVIAPLLVRNNDADMITDQFVAGQTRVRMIASKSKGVERRKGSQILRALGPEFGGWTAANKAFVRDRAGEVFDLNDYVFGNSANGNGKAIYPVHAGVLYSDALSIQPALRVVDDVFRHGGISEDGGAFDAEKHKASVNIFTTRSVMPGTLFVQSLVIPGRRLTRGALDHLLLAVGLAGAYGGSTATTGTNIATHLAGLYWGKLERALNAPERMLRVEGLVQASSAAAAVACLQSAFDEDYPHGVDAAGIRDYVYSLVERFEREDAELVEQYRNAAAQMRDLFDAWFTPNTPKKETKRKSRSGRTTDATPAGE